MSGMSIGKPDSFSIFCTSSKMATICFKTSSTW